MKDESLSALLDGECSPAEVEQLLQDFERNPALRERFDRMLRAQELRRNARVRRLPPDFSARIMAALPERPDPPGKVTPLRPVLRPAAPAPKAVRTREWRPTAGLAAAAALGAIAVLVLRPEAPPTIIQLPAVATAPDAAEAALAKRVSQLESEQQRQLRNYLMAYSQSRAQQGMGTLGYARYAAHSDSAEVAPAPAPDAQR